MAEGKQKRVREVRAIPRRKILIAKRVKIHADISYSEAGSHERLRNLFPDEFARKARVLVHFVVAYVRDGPNRECHRI